MADIPVYEGLGETLATATANGQAIFANTFLAFDETQVRVEFRPSVGSARALVLNTDYTVSGLNQPNGGSVTLVGVTVALGDQVYMYRETPIEREKDWQNEGDYKADLVNREQDEIYMIMQELNRGFLSSVSSIAIEAAARIAGDQSLSDRIDLMEGVVTDAADRAEDAANSSEEAKGIAVDAADRAEAAAATLNLPTIQPGDAGKPLVVNDDEDGYDLGSPSSGTGEYESRAKVAESTVPETDNFLRTAGYYAPGDGGGALYKRVATQPAHAGKVQSADGAWWEITSSEFDPRAFGARADGSTNASPAIQGAINANRFALLSEGKFQIGTTVLVDNSTMNGETESGPKGSIIRGQDARQTIMMAAGSLTTAMLHLKYGLDASAHSMHKYENFSLVGSSRNQKGIQVTNAAFLHMDGVTVRGTSNGLDLVSVLSSSFKDMRIDANVNGIVATKGAGFSYPNALSFENVVISNNSGLGYSGNDPTHNLNIIRGTVEGNGTQGNASTGGIFLNFEGGIEGNVGANINGVYFEGNGGAADLRLDNTGGSRYVTVIVQGCNFNRINMVKYTTHNIRAAGRINLILIGNAFRGYNDYVEDGVNRPYLLADPLVRVIAMGNFYDNAASAGALMRTGAYGTFRGSVASGVTSSLLPSGWAAVKASAGVTTISHNLADLSLYDVVATSTDGSAGGVQRVVKNNNQFQVVTQDGAGALTDKAFSFIVVAG